MFKISQHIEHTKINVRKYQIICHIIAELAMVVWYLEDVIWGWCVQFVDFSLCIPFSRRMWKTQLVWDDFHIQVMPIAIFVVILKHLYEYLIHYHREDFHIH